MTTFSTWTENFYWGRNNEKLSNYVRLEKLSF